jgi:hypothetical protein
MKKRQHQNARGLKTKTSDEKVTTPKCKELKTKTSDKKRGNSKMQEAQNKDLRWKKMQPQNAQRDKNRRRFHKPKIRNRS